MSRNSNCKLCKLSRGCKTVCLWGDGTRYDNPIMFIGEAPGANEDATGIPFIGASGKILNKMIRDILKLERNKVYITNTVKCRPPSNRTPVIEEIKSCREYLHQEINSVKPRLIVTLGITAHRSLFYNIYQPTDIVRMETVRSYKRMSFGVRNVKVFSTYHPAAVIYNPNLRTEFEQDFLKIKELANV